jgi:hypothetical protein
MTLPDSFLQNIIRSLDGPDVVGMTMSGSFARNQASRYSDVDIQRYMHVLPESRYEHYILQYVQGRLVSVKTLTVEEAQKSLTRPDKAIWAIPGLRQMNILLDKEGILAGLKQAAEQADWSRLQPAADEFAADELMGYAEEVHKLLDGLEQDSESKVVYAVWGMVEGMARTLAVHHGLLIPSENEFFQMVQDSAGHASDWTRSFRIAAGMDPAPLSQSPYRVRGEAALRLYVYTARPLLESKPERYREVVVTALKLIQESGIRV